MLYLLPMAGEEQGVLVGGRAHGGRIAGKTGRGIDA